MVKGQMTTKNIVKISQKVFRVMSERKKSKNRNSFETTLEKM